jgi:hypothetical protein
MALLPNFQFIFAHIHFRPKNERSRLISTVKKGLPSKYVEKASKGGSRSAQCYPRDPSISVPPPD